MLLRQYLDLCLQCEYLVCADEQLALFNGLADRRRPKHDSPHVLKDAAAAVAVELGLDDPVAQMLIELSAHVVVKCQSVSFGCSQIDF